MHKYVCATTHTFLYVYLDCAVHIRANHGVLSKSNDGDWRHRPAKMGSFRTMIDIPLCLRMVHSMPYKYVCATTHTLSYVYFDCAVHICAYHGVLSKSNDGDWRHRPAKMGSFGNMIDITYA